MNNKRRTTGKVLELVGTGLVFVSAFLPWLSVKVWGYSMNYSLISAAKEAREPLLNVAVYGLLALCVLNFILRLATRLRWTSFVVAASVVIGTILMMGQQGMSFSYLGFGAQMALFVCVPLLVIGAILSLIPVRTNVEDDVADSIPADEPSRPSGNHVIHHTAQPVQQPYVKPVTQPSAVQQPTPESPAIQQPEYTDGIEDEEDETPASHKGWWLALGLTGVAALGLALFFVLRKPATEAEQEPVEVELDDYGYMEPKEIDYMTPMDFMAEKADELNGHCPFMLPKTTDVTLTGIRLYDSDLEFRFLVDEGMFSLSDYNAMNHVAYDLLMYPPSPVSDFEELFSLLDESEAHAKFVFVGDESQRESAVRFSPEQLTELKEGHLFDDEVTDEALDAVMENLQQDFNNYDVSSYEAVQEEVVRNQRNDRNSNNINDKTYDVVEQMPSFPGGDAALTQFIARNVKYPPTAEENGISGRVVCTFVVERDGSITDIRVVSSVDPSLDKEAMRVISMMPKWNPGRQNGEVVRVKYTVPVNFRLQ